MKRERGESSRDRMVDFHNSEVGNHMPSLLLYPNGPQAGSGKEWKRSHSEHKGDRVIAICLGEGSPHRNMT